MRVQGRMVRRRVTRSPGALGLRWRSLLPIYRRQLGGECPHTYPCAAADGLRVRWGGYGVPVTLSGCTSKAPLRRGVPWVALPASTGAAAGGRARAGDNVRLCQLHPQVRRLLLYEQHGAGTGRPAIASLVPPVAKRPRCLPALGAGPACAPDDSLGALTSTAARSRIFVLACLCPVRCADGRPAVLRAAGVRWLLRHRCGVLLRWVKDSKCCCRSQ